jgi:alpha-tubulin suppressor-like RCC1 family protein
VFSPAESGGSIVLANGSQHITISNNSGSSQSMNLSVSQSGISIALNRCNGTLANNRSCSITLSVNAALLPNGTTIAPLLNNSQSMTSLSYTKTVPVEISEFSQTSVSISDFSQQTITITNKTLSSKSYAPTFSGTDASKFSILLNRCSNVGVSKSCQITYKLNQQPAGSYSAQLTESQVSIPSNISAVISSSAPGVIQPQVSSFSVSTNSLDFGTLSRYGLSSPLNIILTNTGNVALVPIIQLSSNMGLALNRCSSIPVGQTCSLSIGVNPPSSMANGPIVGESVVIKKNSGDSGQSISVSANLNVVVTCSLNQHYESGSCVSNARTCAISNGSGSQSWSSGNWGQCNLSSCNSGYYQNANSCALITYSGVFSNYSPAPASVVTCQGNVISSRTVISCMRDDNFQLVSTSNCIDLASSISTQSPAGNVNASIANGSETYSCALGSSTQIFVSRTCNSGFHDSGSSCDSNNYIPTYSAYVPAIPTSQNICDGTVTSIRTISDCKQQNNNVSVSTSLCSDSSPSVVSQSPAGNVNVSISNGSEVRSCSLGSSTQNFVSRTCNSGFFNNGTGCASVTYNPTYSNYTPAIPTLNTCDGSVISTRTILECRETETNNLVSNSFCSDSFSSVTTLSPSGNINISISNGTEIRSCGLGSSTQTFISRTCNSGYYNNGTICSQIVYVPTYSSYSPLVPTSQNVCDGTVTSTRTISDCKQQHDNLSVSTSLCSDSSPSVISQSPAGNINSSIANGSETYSCSLGSSTQIFVSRTCNLNYINNGSICEAEITNVEIGGNSSYVLNSAGKLYLFGTNGWGLLGNGSTAAAYTPTEPSYSGVLAGKTIKAAAIGPNVVNHYSTVVIASDNLVYNWGSNQSGSLGITGTTAQSSPVAVNTSGVLAGKTILKIATVGYNTCVIASDNKVYCWGRNLEGNLGSGTTGGQSDIPVATSSSSPMFSKTATDLYMGGSSVSFSCAKTSDGVVYCWGDNTYGQLCSTGSIINTPTAVNQTGALAGKTIIGITLSGASSFFHTSDGKLYACGRNNTGQLGINSITDVSVATEVSTANFTGRTISKFSFGNNAGIIVTSDNYVYSWGNNAQGRTGLGLSSGNTLIPTKVVLPGDITAKAVSSSTYNQYALGVDNKVYSWGAAFYGTLGNGQTSTDALTPVTMTGTLSTLTTSKIYSGWNEFCAVTNLNKLYCVGQGVGGFSTPTLRTLP